VERAAFLVGEVVALVVRDQLDNRALGQRCRLIENQPAFLDACSETAHAIYCMARQMVRQVAMSPSQKPSNQLLLTRDFNTDRVARLAPALTIAEDEIDLPVAVMEDALAAAHQEAKERGRVMQPERKARTREIGMG